MAITACIEMILAIVKQLL